MQQPREIWEGAPPKRKERATGGRTREVKRGEQERRKDEETRPEGGQRRKREERAPGPALSAFLRVGWAHAKVEGAVKEKKKKTTGKDWFSGRRRLWWFGDGACSLWVVVGYGCVGNQKVGPVREGVEATTPGRPLRHQSGKCRLGGLLRT